MKRKLTYDIIFELVSYLATVSFIIIGVISDNKYYINTGGLTVLTIALPRVIMKIFKIKVSSFLNFSVQFFIFIAMFLGKVNNFYAKFSWWDLFLHAVSGIVIFLIAYMVFLLQNDCEKDNIKPVLIITYTILFAVAMTAVWEVWEFTGDQFLGLCSQESLEDTMEDIIAGSTGPLVMFPFLYYYLKGKKNILFDSITTFIRDNNRRYKLNND